MTRCAMGKTPKTTVLKPMPSLPSTSLDCGSLKVGGFAFQAAFGTRFFFASFGQSFFKLSGLPQLKQVRLEELLFDEVETGLVEVLSLLPGFFSLRAADTCFWTNVFSSAFVKRASGAPLGSHLP